MNKQLGFSKLLVLIIIRTIYYIIRTLLNAFSCYVKYFSIQFSSFFFFFFQNSELKGLFTSLMGLGESAVFPAT